MSNLLLGESMSDYREYYGSSVKQMPRLLADNRVPLSVHGITERRLAVHNASRTTRYAWTSRTIRHAWHGNYFDTTDGVAYNTNGKFKIVLDAQPLLAIGPDSCLRDGALVLDDDTYKALPGDEFSKADRKYFNKPLTEREALKHEGLRLLLRGDAERIIPAIFQIGQESYGHTEMMGLRLRDRPTEAPEMRAWFLFSILNRSTLAGSYDLTDSGGRLVGVARRAQYSPAPRVASRTVARGDTNAAKRPIK